MAVHRTLQTDVVIFGGGVAGLWLLDELHRAGFAVLLLEAGDLGQGQTIASQGIIHGGLKYTLAGLFNRSADAIRDMPAIWRDCLAGAREPDLTCTRVRANHCHLWRTESVTSRLGMIGASIGLRVKPQTVSVDDRPVALAHVPGTVARLDEQVIDPASLQADFAHRHHARILKVDFPSGVDIVPNARGFTIDLRTAADSVAANARTLVLTAGSGAADLRQCLGLDTSAMQTRPLHMVMARGTNLPELNGHCVDGAKTRVTITTDRDAAGRTVWQIGGQLAEDGVDMDPRMLIAHAQHEVSESLPDVDLTGIEWATYRADRAEGAAAGKRPDDVVILQDGHVITAWPTKLALAPRLSDMVRSRLAAPAGINRSELESSFTNWPRPKVALPPWETATQWFAGDSAIPA